MILQPAPLDDHPVTTDLAQRRAYLEAILAHPRTNDGRRAWARAELKRLKEQAWTPSPHCL